ncbi:hypothetical protein [uncultured Cohaesibacter sp.]|uniref:hypothetical protein n=1 Tax=uncultured Cohaesibacter sp. TaxID=1002546 RepID=UPI0029C91DC8|nr:hypothetical protein [uncultured Cohaesibacter sp.]
MDFETILRFIIAAMFSPPGIANFIICTILKKRWQASIAAFLAASAIMFMNSGIFSQQSAGLYTLSVVLAVLAMMVSSHLGFTIGAKIVRKGK